MVANKLLIFIRSCRFIALVQRIKIAVLARKGLIYKLCLVESGKTGTGVRVVKNYTITNY